MENEGEVNKLEKFLECAIPVGDRMVSYSLQPWSKHLQEFGIHRVNAEIITQSNGKETLGKVNVTINVCSKCNYLRTLFPNGLEIEISFYNYILPALKQFVIDQGGCRLLDFFPKFYGARNDLHCDEFDEDGILLLENVDEITDNENGFEFETTKNILRDLAIFHAVPIAFQSINPDKFNAEIVARLPNKRTYSNVSQTSESQLLDVAIKAAELSDEGEDLLPRVVKAIGGNLRNFSSEDFHESEQFRTIIHNNLCTRSVVTKFENDIPVENQFIGFNMIEYGSLARDLVFLLLGSVNMDVLKESYLEFVTFYYNIFISVLMELHCDTHQFTLEVLHEEINLVASTLEFFHLILMATYLHGERGDFQINEDDTEVDYFLKVQPNERCLQRMHEIIIFFGKKCWI